MESVTEQELVKRAVELNKMIDDSYASEDELLSKMHIVLHELDDARQMGDSLLEEDLIKQLDQLTKEEKLLSNQRNDIWKQQDELNKKVYFLKPPVGCNDKVDLRTKDGRNYEIYLHETEILVGNVEYRGYHVSEFLGDVGGYIEEEYRGHHYIYEALCVLGEILNEQGVNDFWVTTFEENIPSKKSIERFGGQLLSSDNNPPGVLLYECLTKKKEYSAKK